MLYWDRDECSCSVLPSGGYTGKHTGPHIARSRYGVYVVEPWGQNDRFHATFQPDGSENTIALMQGVSWSKAYGAAKDHFKHIKAES